MTAVLGHLSRVRRLAARFTQGVVPLTGSGRRDRRRRGVTPGAASPRLLKALRRLVVAYGPLTAALAIAAVLDPRTLMGEPVWVKPLKFSVSIGLNGAALLWLVRRSPATRFVRGAALLSALGLVVEQALIMLQAARGVRSHFNTDTAFDGAVFAGMGASLAAGVGVATIVLAVVFALRPPPDPVLARVARSGLGLMLLGFAVGAVMLARGATRWEPPTVVQVCPWRGGPPTPATCARHTSSACTASKPSSSPRTYCGMRLSPPAWPSCGR